MRRFLNGKKNRFKYNLYIEFMGKDLKRSFQCVYVNKRIIDKEFQYRIICEEELSKFRSRKFIRIKIFFVS